MFRVILTMNGSSTISNEYTPDDFGKHLAALREVAGMFGCPPEVTVQHRDTLATQWMSVNYLFQLDLSGHFRNV